jgi:glycosyltransferase involved in cell wall biosynthesis
MKISVVIPTYKRANIIRRAIDSVLKQTFQDFEIIVVDDCSNDNTEQVVKAIQDRRIIYIKHTTNKGGCAARNTGIKAAGGEYIAFLDSDDEWLPKKLERQYARFQELDTNVGVVYCGMHQIDDKGALLRDILPVKQGQLLEDLLIGNCVGSFSVVMIRKIFLEKVGYLDESLPSCQDWDLYLRLSKFSEFYYVKDVLINYYIHNDSHRITKKRAAVVVGYGKILSKFKDDISLLPKIKKAGLLYFIGRVFIEVGASVEGLGFVWKAFMVSGELKYFCKFFWNLLLIPYFFVRGSNS